MERILTLENMAAVAKDFFNWYPGSSLFAFHGEMGSGKTTFIHALCDAKKVTSTVGSPTFSIINQYDYPQGKIYHIDLYRLKDEEEVLRTGVEECFYSGDICFIEWPEKAGDLMPPDAIHLYIETIDPQTRKIHTEPSPQIASNSI